jgi:hypothetical protein
VGAAVVPVAVDVIVVDDPSTDGTDKVLTALVTLRLAREYRPAASPQTRLSPPNSSETEVSSKTASMASAMILATERISSLSK